MSSFTDELLAALKTIPESWQLTPVLNKAAYRYNWQEEIPLSREFFSTLLREGDTSVNKKDGKPSVVYPNGIGLRTGIISGGILAVDADGDAAQQKLLELGGGEPLPKTVAFTSGKPGRCQYLFTIPQELWTQIKTRKIDTGVTDEQGKKVKLELRWNGHQSVLPPSKHPETGQYRWVHSPENTSIAPCPEWLLELVRDKQKLLTPAALQREPKIHRARSNAEKALVYLDALSPSRADDYEEWLKVGMALKSVGDESLLDSWDSWSQQSPKYKPGECEKKWNSFKRDTGVTLGTLAHFAKQDGFHTPSTTSSTSRSALAPTTVGQIRHQKVRKEDGGYYEDTENASQEGEHPIPHSSDPVISFTQKAFHFLTDGEHWICADDILYRHTGNHYAQVTDAELIPKLAGYCNSYMVVDKQGNITFPYTSREYVDKALKWIKALVMIKADTLNPPGINCTNGVLTVVWENGLPDVQLEPHHPGQYYTYEPIATYDPHADPTHCDRLLECLDPDQRDIFLKIIGASLDLEHTRKTQGRDIRGLLLKGNGNNGKDALREVVALMYGKQGMTSCSLSDFKSYDEGRKFPLARLKNSRVNWSSENTDSSSLDKLQSIKQFLTGEPLSVELKGLNEYEFTPQAVGLFNINDIPRMRGTLEAIESRWAIVTFLKTFKSNPDPKKGELQADPRFKYDATFVQENVVPAFLNRAIEGLKKLMVEGISYACTRDALEAVQRENCHLFQFCQDVGLEFQPDSTLSAGELWQILEQWYLDNGTLSYEDTGKGKPKPLWIDQPKKGDANVKGANQIIARLLPLFPKAKRVTIPKTGGGKPQQGVLGLAITHTTPNSSPTASPTDACADNAFHPLHPLSPPGACPEKNIISSQEVFLHNMEMEYEDEPFSLQKENEEPLAHDYRDEILGVVGEKSLETKVSGCREGDAVGEALGETNTDPSAIEGNVALIQEALQEPEGGQLVIALAQDWDDKTKRSVWERLSRNEQQSIYSLLSTLKHFPVSTTVRFTGGEAGQYHARYHQKARVIGYFFSDLEIKFENDGKEIRCSLEEVEVVQGD